MHNTATPEVTVSTPEEGTIGLGVTSRLRYTAPVAEGLTFRLCLRNGHIIIYASTLPNPSSALYDRRETVRASAHPITCLTMFYEFGSRSTSEENRRRKRQLPPTETFSLYITLEGQDDINDFIFNSSIGNVSLGKTKIYVLNIFW